MKKVFTILSLILTISLISFSQGSEDSLVKFTDLAYHSDFEKIAIHNYVAKSSDTFNIFLAIDENMNNSEAITLYQNYKNFYSVLQGKKFNTKNPDKKIKIIYPAVHEYFLKKYSANEYFPIVFKTGLYNCVTASALYAMVFNHYKIPYKVMASSQHTYLIANPGESSIVIETTNPNFELSIFNGEFKQNYVNYLLTSKLISEDEVKSKSTEEIFEERYKKVNEVRFSNLIGIQYYNKAVLALQNNNIKPAYELGKKAYFFYPDLKTRTLLNVSLLLVINKCSFDIVTDVDYIAQLTHFENVDPQVITGYFSKIISLFLQYNDKQDHIDSLFQRLAPQISNKTILDEISFLYFSKMGRQFFQTNKAEYYISNAIRIKSNHNDANTLLKAFIGSKLNRISDPQAMLDTLKRLDVKYQYDQVKPILKDYKRIAWLKMAEEFYNKKNPEQGDRCLSLFEGDCNSPVDNQLLIRSIESTYRSVAVFYYYKNQKMKAKSYIDKALKYAPNSNLKKSAIYQD